MTSFVQEVLAASGRSSGEKDDFSIRASKLKNRVDELKFRSQSFTSLMADLRQDINRVSSFSRCSNGKIP